MKQLIFVWEEEKPPGISQTFEHREMSLAEMTLKRQQFFNWGKDHNYPVLAFSWLRGQTILHQGELAWRQSLLHQEMSWILAAIEHIEQVDKTNCCYELLRK